MRNPILTFCKSAKGNYIYKIFRSKNVRRDYTIDYCVNNNADILAYEETNESFEYLFNDYNISIFDDDSGFLVVSSPFDIIKSDTSFVLNLKNNSLAIPHTELKVFLGKNVISAIELKLDGDEINTERITDPITITELIKINSDNSILLNKNKFNYNECSISIKIYCIEITDYQANGLYDPVVSMIESKDFFLLYQDTKYQKNIYYYTTIAYNETSISEFSDTKAIEVSEIPQNIRTYIEYSDDFYTSDTPTWKIFRPKSIYVPISEIKIKKNEIISETVKNIYEHEIYVDDRLLISDGLRTLKIPNIWHIDRRDIMQRQKKVFRFKNVSLEDNTVESNYSNLIMFEKPVEVLTDKMIILKKNVTGLSDDVAKKPLTINSDGVEVLKVYVRQGGIYYKDYIAGGNELDNVTIYKDLTSSVTLDSRFPMFSIKDNCVYSYKYNYTVYLYDEVGNISAPVSVVI